MSLNVPVVKNEWPSYIQAYTVYNLVITTQDILLGLVKFPDSPAGPFQTLNRKYVGQYNKNEGEKLRKDKG